MEGYEIEGYEITYNKPKVTKYKVCHNRELDKMLKKVNKLLDEGWELYGNYIFKDAFHFQAVVKRG